MKKIILLAVAICGIQIASAQTVTPSSQGKQHSTIPSDKQKMDHSSTDKKMEKRTGSAGTYTTSNQVPGDLPSDTATSSRRQRPVVNPETPKN